MKNNVRNQNTQGILYINKKQKFEDKSQGWRIEKERERERERERETVMKHWKRGRERAMLSPYYILPWYYHKRTHAHVRGHAHTYAHVYVRVWRTDVCTHVKASYYSRLRPHTLAASGLMHTCVRVWRTHICTRVCAHAHSYTIAGAMPSAHIFFGGAFLLML